MTLRLFDRQRRGAWILVASLAAALPSGSTLAVQAQAIPLTPSTQGQSRSANGDRFLRRRGEPVEHLHRWVRALEAHQPGSLDDGATQVAALTTSQLREVWIEVNCLLLLMENPRTRVFTFGGRVAVLYTPDELDRLQQLALSVGGLDPMRTASRVAMDRAAAARARLLKRAAILHTDIARLAKDVLDTPPPPGPAPAPAIRGTTGFDFVDGQILGTDRTWEHWAFARALLDRVRPPPAHDPDVQQWYRATLTWLVSVLHLHWTHVQQAARLYPDDPQILFLRGCLHEAFASSRVQVMTRALTSAGQPAFVRSVRAELEEAESLFQRALDREPQLIEARLHRGRVRDLLGKHAAAAVDLRQALGMLSEPVLRYYGHLFLGSALASLGQADAARAAYAQGAAIQPFASAPRLALGQLATTTGERSAALDALDEVFEGREPDDEPWWSYEVAAGRSADADITAAYAALLRTPAP